LVGENLRAGGVVAGMGCTGLLLSITTDRSGGIADR